MKRLADIAADIATGIAVEVAVLGGGPAGAVAAMSLARVGHRVALIDRPRPVMRKVGEALPPAARPLLNKLGLLSVIEHGPHLRSFGNSSAWGENKLTHTDFIRDPNGLGWHLDRRRFDADLVSQAERAGAVLIPQGTLGFAKSADGWNIELESKQSVAAKWVIDASGRAAIFARSFGATRQRDDNLTAVYAWTRCMNKDQDSRTLIESCSAGWWYTAKLPDQSRVVILHTDAREASQLLKTRGLWEARLGKTVHIQGLLDGCTFETKLSCSEACGARLDRFGGDHWLAAGDAAMSFDPLSSQGLFNAMYSGMKSAQGISECLTGSQTHELALASYTARLNAIRRVYLARQDLFYAAEQRWVESPFWKVRTVSAPEVQYFK